MSGGGEKGMFGRCCCTGLCDYAVVTAGKAFQGWPKLTLVMGEEVDVLYQKLVIRQEARWFPYAASATYPSETCDKAEATKLDARNDWWEATFECDKKDGQFKLVELNASCVDSGSGTLVYRWQRTSCQADGAETIIFPTGGPCSDCQDASWPTVDCFLNAAGAVRDTHMGAGGCQPGTDGGNPVPNCNSDGFLFCDNVAPVITSEPTHYRSEITCLDTSVCYSYDVQLFNPVTKAELASDVIALLDLVPLPIPDPPGKVVLPGTAPEFFYSCDGVNYINIVVGDYAGAVDWGGQCVKLGFCDNCYSDVSPAAQCHTTPNDMWPDDENPLVNCFSRNNAICGQVIRRPAAWLLASKPTLTGALYAGQTYMNDMGGYGIMTMTIQAMKSIRAIPGGPPCEFANEQLWDPSVNFGLGDYVCANPDDIICLKNAPIIPDGQPDLYVFKPNAGLFGHYYWPEDFNNNPCPC